MKNLRVPDIFVVGAAKSGTTSLWKYLGSHEDIFMTEDLAAKELGYYCRDYGIEDEAQYLSYFEKARENQLIGEACHAYLTSPESAELIKSANPNSKIIIVLRNPVDRAYSLYNWMVQYGYEFRSFKGSTKREKKVITNPGIVKGKWYHSYWKNYLYLETGKYYQQVKRYYDVFGPDNVLVIIADDLRNDTSNTMNRVAHFLKIKPFDSLNVKFENESVQTRFPLMNFIAQNLLRHYSFKFRSIRVLLKYMIRLSLTNVKPKKLAIESRKNLNLYYSNDIKSLEGLLRIDLSKWLV